MTEQRRYTRDDLDHLKTLGRSGVFEALGSFDDTDGDAHVLASAGLLDHERIPGLADAVSRGDADGAGRAVLGAIQTLPPIETPGLGYQLDDNGPKVIPQAEDVLRHRFTFYGETYQLPDDIDWEYNPGTDHWGHDLNRFTYLFRLVSAFRTTGRKEFIRKGVELILDWIAKADFADAFRTTPYVFGSYLNQSNHSGCWAWYIREVVNEGVVEPREAVVILKSLHDHLAYLDIVTANHVGNWPTIGTCRMLEVLAHLPLFKDTDRFACDAIETMEVQVNEQVLPDGVQFELTPGYHRGVQSNILLAVRYARELGMTPDLAETLRAMNHYSSQTCVPNDGGMQVAFNDTDPEKNIKRLLMPGEEPEELGPELFPWAGVAFLRQRESEGDLYLAFDIGPFGKRHQHEDKLGFWLHAYGRSFIVDPGRHLYDDTERSYLAHLRSTRAHSTIMIDGEGQSTRRLEHLWVATEPLSNWSEKPGEIRAWGQYTHGYAEDNSICVTHRREIVFMNDRFWVVFDVVEGDGEHLVESRFQFAPGPLHLEERGAVTGFDDANLLLRMVSPSGDPGLRIDEREENPRAGWYSASYNKIEPAPALVAHTRTTLPWRSATLLYPFHGDTPQVSFTFDGTRAVVVLPEMGRVDFETTL
jgi:hypothetical protein